jgi:hypothetical protein
MSEKFAIRSAYFYCYYLNAKVIQLIISVYEMFNSQFPSLEREIIKKSTYKSGICEKIIPIEDGAEPFPKIASRNPIHYEG